MKLLACPKCHQQLHLENKTLKCENNHCYDISKRGYINLLLNPDKATNNPGDSNGMQRCMIINMILLLNMGKVF